tara:strand:+ start:107 stop:433 length:327 start_codon:yes stop_codon:yes gene_type:complete
MSENKELESLKDKLLVVQDKIANSNTKREQLALYKEYSAMLRHLVEYIFFEHNKLENAFDVLSEKYNKSKEYRKNYYEKNKKKIKEYQKDYQKNYRDNEKKQTTVNFE